MNTRFLEYLRVNKLKRESEYWKYIIWINEMWGLFCKQENRNRDRLQEKDHNDFDVFLSNLTSKSK